MFTGFNQATTLKNSNTEKDLELAEKNQFDFFEFQMGPLKTYLMKHSLTELKVFFDNNNIKPHALNVLEYFNLKSGKEFKEMEEEFAWMCEVAKKIGCKIIILVPSRKKGEMTYKAIKDDSIVCVNRLLDIIESGKYDMKLSYEFLGFEEFSVNNFYQCYDIVHDIDDDRVGITIDCFHFYASNSKISDLKKADGKKIFCFHVDDSKEKPLNELTDDDRVWPGDGVLPFNAIMPVIKEIGYKGVASIELFNPDYWKLGADETVSTAKQKLDSIINKYF